MDTDIAERLAGKLMSEHIPWELGSPRWRFEYDTAKNRFGRCNYRTRTIGLSRTLVELNDIERVRETLLHEIAHALAGPSAGHGIFWKAQCYKLGIRPDRCFTTDNTIVPDPPYVGICPNCEQVRSKGFRRTKKACGRCCNRLNHGKFDPRFLLVWERSNLTPA